MFEERGDFWSCLTSRLGTGVWAGGGCWDSGADSEWGMEERREACGGLPACRVQGVAQEAAQEAGMGCGPAGGHKARASLEKDHHCLDHVSFLWLLSQTATNHVA